jgi:hypothetical protein
MLQLHRACSSPAPSSLMIRFHERKHALSMIIDITSTNIEYHIIHGKKTPQKCRVHASVSPRIYHMHIRVSIETPIYIQAI